MRKQKKIAGMIILILASLGLGGCDSREPIQTQPASKGSAESVSAELSSGAVVEIFSFSELKGSRFVFSSGAGAWQTELTVAEDGLQAVRMFQEKPEGYFDAILMDIIMPVIDGLTATNSIRSLNHPDAKKIPIIAMTANAFKKDKEKCLAAEMNAHLPKPIEIENVKKVLCEQIKP